MTFTGRVSTYISGKLQELGGQPVADAAAAAPRDELGSYPTKNDVLNNRARRDHLSFRLCLILIGILLVSNLVLGNIVLMLLPLYRVVPFFVTFSDKADQVVRIDPPAGTMASFDILTEVNVRDYVKMRNTIGGDMIENRNRWLNRIRLMSSPDVFEAFEREIQPVVAAAIEGKFTRSIVINSVLAVEPGYYRVEFEAIDQRIGSGFADTTERTLPFVADLRVINVPANVAYEQRFENPLGFTVIGYTVARRSSPSPARN